MTLPLNLAGKIFGRLTAVKPTGEKSSDGQVLWFCRCECGKESVTRGHYLKSGHAQSCGCLRGRANRTHGHATPKSYEYQTWQHMKDRCLNKKSDRYNYYGARGITICERWMKFEDFLQDMGRCPLGRTGRQRTYTLHRRNNEGPYCKENCSWATWEEQNDIKNKRSPYSGHRSRPTANS